MIRVCVRIKVTEPSKNAASVCLLWKYGGDENGRCRPSGTLRSTPSAAMSISHLQSKASGKPLTLTLIQIVSSHLRTDCQRCTRMNDGAYACAFLSLVTGIQVVGRVISPVRESIKTEAKVTIMELVRGVHIDPIVAPPHVQSI